jgi:hypothetical protein
MHKYGYLFLLLFSFFTIHGQINPLVTGDSLAQRNWVEAKYAEMTLEEKVGQLFMVSIASNQKENTTSSIKKLIKEEHIGNAIGFHLCLSMEYDFGRY